MATSRQPDQVFCLRCGPDVALSADDRQPDWLRCPVCGDRVERSRHPLFVVAGASGAGKTTLVPALRRRRPDCEIFDVDLTLHIAALGWETWRNTWLQLAGAIGLNGRSTVLCGTFRPGQLAELPGRVLVGPIHFCLLNPSDETIAARLRARPAWRGCTDASIREQTAFAAQLRGEITAQFDTGTLDVSDTAAAVASWIERHLDSGREG
jgi:hypothetical protein